MHKLPFLVYLIWLFFFFVGSVIAYKEMDNVQFVTLMDILSFEEVLRQFLLLGFLYVLNFNNNYIIWNL